MIVKSNAQSLTATSSTKRLVSILQENRAGRSVGVFSICSANPYVLQAAMTQASRDDRLLLIESTSNQVNQFGGYTGQTPAEFVAFLDALARENKFPRDRILLGGDHLGPHPWQKESAASAMEKGCTLVREYVRAGYAKIHLDTSMRCTDDPIDTPLPDELITERAAMLAEAAESARAGLPDQWPLPLYVVGTEVPRPGGTQYETVGPEITQTAALERTLQLTKTAFLARRLDAAWQRVIAVVVQPGVEFGDSNVFPYDSRKIHALSRYVEKSWTGVYEAHSTDYQSTSALEQMVRDHFAILKVGPWLTFAFREAVFALAEVEEEWFGAREGIVLSGVRDALEAAMKGNPIHWQAHYQGDENALRLARKYSYSDRCRYYWPQPEVSAALHRLMANLRNNPAPVSLLSQYLPAQCEELRAGQLRNDPLDLIRSKIMHVLDHYALACGMRTSCPEPRDAQ